MIRPRRVKNSSLQSKRGSNEHNEPDRNDRTHVESGAQHPLAAPVDLHPFNVVYGKEKTYGAQND